MHLKWLTRLITSTSLASILFYSTTSQAAPYDLIDLGTLGGVENFAFSINELNEVTGHADGLVVPDDQITETNPAITCPLSNGQTINRTFCNHAYFYANGVIIDLGDLGKFGSYGFSINDNSTIVGHGIEEIDDGDDSTTNPVHDRAFISFGGGALEAIPYPAEASNLAEDILPEQRAFDISNDNKIVGYAKIQNIDDANIESARNRPYVYDYNTASYTIIPLFSDTVTRSGSARAINSSGVVVGWADSEAVNNLPHALLWDPASPDVSIDLGTLGGLSSDAYDINDNGIVVGKSETSELFVDNNSLGFIYDSSLETPMQAIPEFSDAADFKTSLAYAINNSNQVVGTARIRAGFTPKDTAFRYDYADGTLINLNDMVDCSLNWELVVAKDINNSGSIIGYGVLNGEVHSFLLIPTADTVPTNCTALRAQATKDSKIEASGSGSLGILMLLFISSLVYWRRNN